MERIVERTMLYDFYGDLLTEHQKKVYEYIVSQDLSLSEAAELEGISRQGVHDLVRRCDRLLSGYEEKLHLVERFLAIRESVEALHRQVEDYAARQENPLPPEIETAWEKLLDEI